MEASYQVLEQLYKKMLLGGPLEKESQEYAFYLNLPFSAQDLSTSDFLKWPCVHHGNQASSVNIDATPTPVASMNLKMNFQVSNPRDIMLLQLTVIKMMLTKILSKKMEFSIKEKYSDIIEILLKPYELESKLIGTFHGSDKLLSHMAAKCLASLLYLQLREKAIVNKTWTSFCLKTLSDYPESNTISYCLWTLTAVIKEILKATCLQKAEILKQFLTSFDFLFEVFYCSVFSQHFENYQDMSLNPKVTNFLICFLELLEILIASRIHLKLYFTCQRIFYLKIFCALDIITWPIHSLVKKQFIVLLKRCLLHKVGEDVLNTSLPTLAEQDPYLDMDMLTLGNAFLQAVNLGWLKQLSISGKPSHFGGSEVQPGNKSLVHDLIILRASSLVLLKSLEIKVHNCTSANEVKAELQKFMSGLLTFLKQHLQPSLKLHHHCEWISKIFIEQDDDMLEATKASLSIYLKFTSIVTSRVEERSNNQATHHPLFCGTNHYALLPLASDPTAFGTNTEQKDKQIVKSKQSNLRIDNTSSPGTSQSLVDYDSSEDSEEESVEEKCLSNIKQTSLNLQDITEIRETISVTGEKNQSYLESTAKLLDPKESSNRSSFGCQAATKSTAYQTVISCKTLKCLKELERAISRLHRRHLFPYNPSALLKLLKHIDAINKNK
ncbi:protein Lines homolog 1 isoform X2 [Petaurus breviceps papuanus]|uniref:protein Lines homolog 1 isoform X2 n=1 Tax=Petaurus breviceps papuanus TaxID=3040969 RepID=UPI0036D98DCA